MLNDTLMIGKVRISFPHLFTKPIIQGDEGKYGATLMLDPAIHKNNITEIEQAMLDLVNRKFKGRTLPADRLCLRDGEDKGRPEYNGLKVLSANSKSKPLVVSVNGKDIIAREEDSPIYAGCYVNAKIRLWAQDNKFGKRVNCELIAVQFVADGEALDGGHISVDEAMSGFNSITEDDYDFLAA